MRRFFFTFFCLTLLAASCAPQPVLVKPDISAPQSTRAYAPEIRFALIGVPKDSNSWELFDKTGASYADYALRSEYFPRLYHLAPPELSLQPLAAQGLPSAVIQDGEFYSALVNLRQDLKWTDGSPFTAEDIAFTANTAITFQLGFDWQAFYPRDYLDRVEVVDSYTVKFFFKQKPNVGIWQYGALQAPILQKRFWQPNLIKAMELLPDDSVTAEIEKARNRLAIAQFDVDDLNSKILALREIGQGNRGFEINLTQRELELGYAQNNLDKVLGKYQTQISAARQAVYDLDDKNEPTLGTWIFESKKDTVWINTANPDFPFGKPNFDRAVYTIFDNEKDALNVFENNEADFILSSNEISKKVNGARANSTYSARFLVFNPMKTQFADAAFHAALSCMIDRNFLAVDVLQNKAAPLNAFIISEPWHDAELKDFCAEMSNVDRIEYAVNLLKDAGYSWVSQPTVKDAGKDLLYKNGEAFPMITLSAPTSTADPLRYAAAKYIAAQAQYLGIQFAVREMSADDIVYEVYSSQKYDAALIGWKLSEYPAYICEWFGGGNPMLINGDRFSAACAALRGETNIEAAKNSLRQIQSELMVELPFIPLFTTMRMEAYQNISYPAVDIWNGWSSLYGAPLYAMPSP